MTLYWHSLILITALIPKPGIFHNPDKYDSLPNTNLNQNLILIMPVNSVNPSTVDPKQEGPLY